MRTWTTVALSIVAALAVAQSRPPLFQGMGEHKFKVTTTSPEAQEYFNQGLVLAYGFNHEEAHRSFSYAAALDPGCAMAFWGAAYVLGPNLNSNMPSSKNDEALQLATKALNALDDETPLERALVVALQSRYAAGRGRKDADKDYAEAMKSVVKAFPDESEVLTLTAEALMDLHPWNFWTKEKVAQSWTQEIIDLLTKSEKLNPGNPGTSHFLIHLWEGSPTPEMAEPAADRLPGLAPGVEHLVHMPGHILYRIGRYHDGTETNVKATIAYDDYARACSDMGMRPIGGYEMHNWDFVWAGASYEGRSELAFKAAKRFGEDNRNDNKLIFSYVRFGKWSEILDVRPGDGQGQGRRAAILYARSIAQAHLGDTGAAEAEFAALTELIGAEPRSTMQKIMRGMAAGEIAFARGDHDEAVRLLEEARKQEDSMARGELHGWHHPVRLLLGKVLLAAGRGAEAEKEYREQLLIDKNDGWSLFGLAQALDAQGKSGEAAEVRERFFRAWMYSDVKLTASSF
jgi:tetratricopeptide (TPR) repeat protein